MTPRSCPPLAMSIELWSFSRNWDDVKIFRTVFHETIRLLYRFHAKRSLGAAHVLFARGQAHCFRPNQTSFAAARTGLQRICRLRHARDAHGRLQSRLAPAAWYSRRIDRAQIRTASVLARPSQRNSSLIQDRQSFHHFSSRFRARGKILGARTLGGNDRTRAHVF